MAAADASSSRTGLEALADTPLIRRTREALAGRRVWIVGGAVRDALFGRPGRGAELDLVVEAAPGDELARASRDLARSLRGTAFALSDAFGAWRVVAGNAQIDLCALRGGSLAADLRLRDLTVNAIAVDLADGTLTDPTGGREDLAARRLRAAAPSAFADDPLRLLRLARLAAELGFDLDPETASLARASASRAAEPAGERQFAELRLAIGGPDPLRALEVMAEIAITERVLPELTAQRGVEQSAYHHLDVHDHTLEVLARLVEIERDSAATLGPRSAEVAELLSGSLADGLSRWGALRFAALLHDAAKPATRAVDAGSGRVSFRSHDRQGAELAEAVCDRLRTSRALRRHLTLMVAEHLRLGFLVDRRPLSHRDLYDYLAATHPAPVDVSVLTVADRLATRGARSREQTITAHVELVRQVLGPALEWQRHGPPPAPIRGDELAGALGIAPGPELGRLLAELRAARWTGEATTPEQAIALARTLLRG